MADECSGSRDQLSRDELVTRSTQFIKVLFYGTSKHQKLFIMLRRFWVHWKTQKRKGDALQRVQIL